MQLKNGTRAYIALAVTDLEKAIDFYTNVLGFEIVKHVDVPVEKVMFGRFADAGFSFVTVVNGPYAIKLVRIDRESQPSMETLVDSAFGFRYVGFEVDDFESAFNELAARGVTFLSEPMASEMNQNVPPLVFFRDPDGNLLEIAG